VSQTSENSTDSDKPVAVESPQASAEQQPSAQAQPSRLPLIAAFVGVGLVGVLIGFSIGHSTNLVTVAPAVGSASSSPMADRSAHPPQTFDLKEDPRAPTGIALRPMDREIFTEIMSDHLDRTKMRDLFPDRPYRVALVGSVAEHRIGVVMIDLNRDGKFEERWDLKGSEVTRTVMADTAAEGSSVQYSMAHARWQPH
jgi:hypothetical protein